MKKFVNNVSVNQCNDVELFEVTFVCCCVAEHVVIYHFNKLAMYSCIEFVSGIAGMIQ